MASPNHSARKWLAPSGALSLGALAALMGACCGVPWLVAAIGVTGAIAVSRVAVFAPYLWLLAFGFAITAVVRSHRSESACDVGCKPAQRRRQHVVTWVVFVILLGLFVAARGWQSFAS